MKKLESSPAVYASVVSGATLVAVVDYACTANKEEYKRASVDVKGIAPLLLIKQVCFLEEEVGRFVL